MIFYKNRLIFGTIRRIIKTVFSVLYKIIKAFNLHVTLFVLLLGIVLAIAGTINKEDSSFIVYLVVLGLSVVYAEIKTFNSIFKPNNKKSSVKIMKVSENQIEQQANEQANEQVKEQVQQQMQQFQPKSSAYQPQPIVPQVEKPRYYAVKNNPSYVYAEYSDRYELFLKTSTGLKKVRVDYK
ncbi:MAG: hypothetical protein IKA12_02770 [Clostridia bacterium]|nr:hypothetical protein [Clostridia bacterium]